MTQFRIWLLWHYNGTFMVLFQSVMCLANFSSQFCPGGGVYPCSRPTNSSTCAFETGSHIEGWFRFGILTYIRRFSAVSSFHAVLKEVPQFSLMARKP